MKHWIPLICAGLFLSSIAFAQTTNGSSPEASASAGGKNSNRLSYLGLRGALQSQAFPQVHSLLSFIGQFLPLFLQPAGLSAANVVAQSAAIRIENRIFV